MNFSLELKELDTRLRLLSASDDISIDAFLKICSQRIKIFEMMQSLPDFQENSVREIVIRVVDSADEIPK
mgnify:CR=1 FL=1